MDRERLEIEAGQRFYSGLDGTLVGDDFRESVRRSKLGNVILFSRNISSLPQLLDLSGELDELITSVTGIHPFIMIDQEGGMVSRLPESAPVIPSQMALSSIGDENLVREACLRNGRLLRSLGISINLAPVLDVNEDPLNPVIGIRSFSDRPSEVASLGKAAIEGYKASGILCTAKHFPGHGDTSLDSHLALPSVDKDRAGLEGQLLPFRMAIGSGIDAIMTSHILFPGLGESDVPCTMSRRIVSGLLREELGFDGLVLSDCMEMQAIARYYGTVQGSVRALGATVDLVGISHDVGLCEEAIAMTVEGYLKGSFPEDEWDLSLTRIMKAKERLGKEEPSLPDLIGDKRFFDAAARRALTLVRGIMPCYEPGCVFMGPAPYITSNISDKLDRVSFPEYMGRHFRDSRTFVTSADPGKEEIDDALRSAACAPVIYFGSHNAHLQKGQLRLVEALVGAGLRVVHIALRNPYDLTVDGTCADVCSYEYSARTLEALKEAIEGKGGFGGKLPVALGGRI